jgi:hypothetical protein
VRHDALRLPPTERRLLVKDVTRSLRQDGRTCEDPAEESERQRQHGLELMAELDKLPDGNPDDGLSGRDHDLILYGWRK